MESTDRRSFMKKAALGGATAAAGLAATDRLSKHVSAAPSKSFSRVFYRDLGSTGFKVSEIGFGVLHINDPALIHAALDAGVNYFDTAHGYMNGVCEKTLGEVNKTRRNEYFLTTKVSLKSPAEMMRQMELSLERLRTDHVDLMLVHGPGRREQILGEDAMKTFDEARRKGMTRFVGFSTHNQVEGLQAAIDSKFWEAVTVPYNYFSPPEVARAIEKARTAGIAIIAMKNLITIKRPRKPFPDIRNEKTRHATNQQALLKWVLRNPNVDTTIPGMSSFEHLADDMSVMGMKLTADDRRILRRFSEEAGDVYCRGIAGCTGCRDQCPNGVEVSEINRCLGYAEGYGDERLARENYRELPAGSRVDVCADCDECLVKCVNGLDLTGNIRRAREMFA